MNLKFQKNLEYQMRAVESVAGIFESGKNLFSGAVGGFVLSGGQAVANELDMDDARMVQNIARIQKENGFHKSERVSSLESHDFSVEMETGTGKTYVYIRTILELARRYKLKKFIILVPSIAIREGVKKSLVDMKRHFQDDLDLPNYVSFAYDSGKLNLVRRFVDASDVSIMVTTIQSFNKDGNRMKQNLDQFHGEVPIKKIAETRPVIVMDEPQNMASDLAKFAISELNPLFKLRYSATHKEPINLVYRLGSVEAYRQRLVKRIDVIGVQELGSGEFVFRINRFVLEKGSQPKAKVSLEIKKSSGEYEEKEFSLKQYDDLFRKTKNEKYAGLEVAEVDAGNGRVGLSNGEAYSLEERLNKEEVFRTQIRQTIETHFEKQAGLKNMKVLSLFFIDRVDNYIHDDSLIRKIFEEEFESMKKQYDFFREKDAGKVHDGYFTKKSKTGNNFVDTTGKSEKDRETFDLIMKEKERLLSFDEPVCFIFSHSALREGWDNPNIFQICTLQETRSEMDKRQKIGRGLRLPVNALGERVQDERVNVLTVVANESYDEYVRGLQAEYRNSGQKMVPVGNRARKVKNRVRKEVLESKEFQELWKRICKKTRFSVEFDENALVEHVVEAFKEKDVSNLVVMVEKVHIDFAKNGEMKTIYGSSAVGEKIQGEMSIGNIVERIARDTGLTRKTALHILRKLKEENLNVIFDNPEEFVRSLIVVINGKLNDIVVNNGLRYIETGEVYEAKILFEDFLASTGELVDTEKSVFEKTQFDSSGERAFAENMDTSKEEIRLFTKLPGRFTVDTPLGGYNPDWAIVFEKNGGENLYLVRETKFAEGRKREDILQNLRPSEQIKIQCAKKHFNALGVDFKETTQEDLSDLV